MTFLVFDDICSFSILIWTDIVVIAWECLKKMSDSDAYLFPEVAVGVIRHGGTVIYAHPKFCEKVPCKRVTVGHSERAWVQHHLLVDVEMENVVEMVVVWGRQWDALAMNKCSCHKEQQHSNVKQILNCSSNLSEVYCLFTLSHIHKTCPVISPWGMPLFLYSGSTTCIVSSSR